VLCLHLYRLANIPQLTKLQVQVTLRLTVSQSVSLGVEPHSLADYGPRSLFLFVCLLPFSSGTFLPLAFFPKLKWVCKLLAYFNRCALITNECSRKRYDCSNNTFDLFYSEYKNKGPLSVGNGTQGFLLFEMDVPVIY
jgi:hypothetical protein